MNNPINPPAVVQQVSENAVEEHLNLVRVKLEKIEELKANKKEYREMINNLLENDEEYSERNEKKKDLQREVKEAKNRILGSQEAADIIAKMDDTTADIKDLEESISNHLMVYHQKTGRTTFDDIDGNERTVVYKYKVKPAQLSLFED